MNGVTLLWSMSSAFALTVTAGAALSWMVDRRNLAHLSFCIIAVATAAAMPVELGMMYAATPAEYAEQVRWYHVPIFFALLGHLLFIHYYLGTGRPWLLTLIVVLRLFVVTANFLVEPNFTFREIVSLERVSFLGTEISVIGEGVPRAWQWLANASMLLLMLFVFDAAARAYRRGDRESRRRALVVGIAIGIPMLCTVAVNRLAAEGVVKAPISTSFWFLGTLAAVAYDLSREFIMSRRAQLQLAGLRGELAQVERVNSLGQLASGLAHELKQPLTAALVNADTAERLLNKESPDLDSLRSTIAEIRHDSRRAVETIDGMRALIKRRIIDKQPLALDDVVKDVIALAAPEAVSRRVALECRMQPDLPRVLGDRVHISQVLLNLLINGLEAVSGRPTDRRVLVEGRATATEGVEIAVHDSGPGIPSDKIEEVFSSLFTTKSAGMGVGLALSRTIIEAHGGRLWAENEPTGGASFRFTLPLA